jgi:uncharacterized protein
MTQITITEKQARTIVAHAQLLGSEKIQAKGKELVARTIEKLGYVQIDTISVVERAHHHTLWSRCRGYAPEMLHELMADDRRIFEYWAHAASYIPMTDYRYYLPLMIRYRTAKIAWAQDLLAKHGHLMSEILDRIRKEGPLSSKDFKPPPGMKRGTWWDWKPAKMVLELLFWQGELMITCRRNFQRVYDLTERVLPQGTDTRIPDTSELAGFFVLRALNALGIASQKDIHDHIPVVGAANIESSIQDQIRTGDVCEIRIDKDDKEKYYILKNNLESGLMDKHVPDQVHILSPFDNLLILRKRVKRIFHFDYAIECYTPASKRQFGYFVLPVMHGNRLVGRLDSKADRKTKTLIINRLGLEPGFKPGIRFVHQLALKIKEFCTFNGCLDVRILDAMPGILKADLEKRLD